MTQHRDELEPRYKIHAMNALNREDFLSRKTGNQKIVTKKRRVSWNKCQRDTQ